MAAIEAETRAPMNARPASTAALSILYSRINYQIIVVS